MTKELDKELYPDYVYPTHQANHDEPIRESIVKLGKMMTDRIPQKLGIKKITQDDPEYWGLAGVLTDEEAEIALKLGVRKPKTLQEIAKLTNLSETELEPKLQEMSVKGILEYPLLRKTTEVLLSDVDREDIQAIETNKLLELKMQMKSIIQEDKDSIIVFTNKFGYSMNKQVIGKERMTTDNFL